MGEGVLNDFVNIFTALLLLPTLIIDLALART